MKLTDIKEELNGALDEYKPYVRWWWFGSAITKKEIRYEMEQMKKQSIGGVEIQPIYSAQKGRNIEEYEDIPWLSEKLFFVKKQI